MPAFNEIGWFEIGTADPSGAEKFYGEVFGWTVGAGLGPQYRFVTTVEGGLRGGLATLDGTTPGHAIFTVVVEDVADTLRRVVAAGGSVLGEPQATPNGLVFAYLRDPDGNAVGVFSPPRG